MNNIQVIDFLEDEAQAREAEERVLHVIQKKYPLAFKKEGNFKDYDIEVPEIKKTIEIKWDKKSKETGNYFVETAFNGEPSGIDATKADWWCIVDEDSICFLPVDSLRYLLRENHCFERSIRGQDGTTVRYRLIKKSTLQSSPYATFL